MLFVKSFGGIFAQSIFSPSRPFHASAVRLLKTQVDFIDPLAYTSSLKKRIVGQSVIDQTIKALENDPEIAWYERRFGVRWIGIS